MRTLEDLQAVHRDLADRTIPPDGSRLGGAGLDVLSEIGSHRDYAALLPRSRVVELRDGLRARVLDFEALIETKKEAGRPKDLATLPVLLRTLEESKRRQ